MLRQSSQNPVTRLVPVNVVVGLEQVYVQHYQREESAEARASGNLLLQTLVKMAVVVQAG